jgi:very-short-patch-repair endonuclease
LLSDGRRHGVGRGRLASRELARPFRGVRQVARGSETDSDGPDIDGPDDGLLETCRAYAALSRPGDAFSHATAAQLLGLPLPYRLRHRSGRDIHVTVPGARRARQLAGVIGHTRNRPQTVLRRGLPVIAPAQTWLDLAPDLSPTELVMVGDALVSDRPALCSIEELAHQASTPRARGVRSARRALEFVRTGVESPQETALRLAIVDAGLPEPAINFEVRNAAGEFVARVDLAYPVHRIAIEYEGDHHRTDRDIWRKDITRKDRVEDLAWRMIRVTIDDLAPSSSDLIGRIRRARAAALSLKGG